jgi:hypothetical protein
MKTGKEKKPAKNITQSFIFISIRGSGDQFVLYLINKLWRKLIFFGRFLIIFKLKF